MSSTSKCKVLRAASCTDIEKLRSFERRKSAYSQDRNLIQQEHELDSKIARPESTLSSDLCDLNAQVQHVVRRAACYAKPATTALPIIAITNCGRSASTTGDVLEQLIGDTNNAGLQYSYDELGNLETLTLPDQRQLNHLYYGSGHLHQINLGGRVISDFERDSLHTRTHYDRNGHLSQKALHYIKEASHF